MKNNFYLVLVCLAIFTTANKSQIFNGGFEDWNANGNPTGWSVTNQPPSFVTVTKSSDAHSGSWAAEGNVTTFSVFTVGPTLISGEQEEGFPINFRPASFKGFYKFTSVSDDFMQVQANFFKNGMGMGVAAANLNPADTYTEFEVGVTFIGTEIPDTVLIAVFLGSLSGFTHIGSKLFIDDLSFSTTTDVNSPDQIPANFNLYQNYPNPFNPSTTIKYSIPNSEFVTLKVFDVLGNEVATLVNGEKPAGKYEVEFEGENISSGVFFYTIKAGSFVETKKMIMLR
jgi:hypothetical protein